MLRMNAGWMVLSPTWSYGREAPATIPPSWPVAGSDALWPDLLEIISEAQAKDLAW